MINTAKTMPLGALFGERVDQQDARDAKHLLHIAAHLRQLLLGLLPDPIGGLANVATGQQHDRHEHQGCHRQAPVEGQHERKGGRDRDDVGHEPEDSLGDDVLNAADVIAHARKQIP